MYISKPTTLIGHKLEWLGGGTRSGQDVRISLHVVVVAYTKYTQSRGFGFSTLFFL